MENQVGAFSVAVTSRSTDRSFKENHVSGDFEGFQENDLFNDLILYNLVLEVGHWFR